MREAIKLQDAEIDALTVLLEALQPYLDRPEAKQYITPIVTCVLTGFSAGPYMGRWTLQQIERHTGPVPSRLLCAWSAAEEVVFDIERTVRASAEWTTRFLRSIEDLQRHGPG